MSAEGARHAPAVAKAPAAHESRAPQSRLSPPETEPSAFLQAAGNLAMAHALRSQGVRPKMTVSAPGDPDEEEADRVAHAVVRQTAVPTVQRKCAACSSGQPCGACEDEVQRKAASPHVPQAASVARAVAAVSSGGHPLPRAVRHTLEPRLRRDLSGIRVHTDAAAGHAARGIGARAYTVGRDIAFAPGEFRPHDRQGEFLIAHELAHVAQSGVAVRRDTAKASPGDAGAGANRPAAPEAKGYTEVFKGVTLSESKEQVVFALKEAIGRSGTGAPDDVLGVVEDFSGKGLTSAKQFKKDYEADPTGVSGGVPESDEEIRRREKVGQLLLPVLRDAVNQVKAETTKLVADFQDVMKDNALQTLAASKTHAEAERLRYGVTTKQEERTARSARTGTHKYTVTTHSIADLQSPAVKGMRAAAKLLLNRRYEIRTAAQEANRHFACFMGTCAGDKEYDRLNAILLKKRKDYQVFHQQIAFEYPLLDRVGAIEEDPIIDTSSAIWALGELERIANSESDTDVAAAIGERIEDTLQKNERATEGVKGNKVNLWRLKDVYGVSKRQAAIDPDPFKKKVIEERWSAEQPHIIDAVLEGIALLVLNLAAIALAAPTGGVSLGIAFGVNAALAAKHTMDYLLDKAVGGSDLRRAQSLSQDDPSFVWLAIEIIGVGLDGAAAVSAMRAMRPVVKAAEIASKDGKLSADAIKAIEKVAADVEKPQLAKNVIDKLPKARTAALELAGGTEQEVGAWAKVTKSIQAEAAESVGASVRSAVGGELKISKAGYLWACGSPCMILREKYAQIFAKDNALYDRLAALERQAAAASKARQAAEAGKDASALAKAEGEMERIKQLAAELETSLHGKYPHLAPPEAQSALAKAAREAELEAEVAGTAGSRRVGLGEMKPPPPERPANFKNDNLWDTYKDYYARRYQAIKGEPPVPGVDRPLSAEAYAEFLGKFQRGTEYQGQVLGRLTGEAKAPQGQRKLLGDMADPVIESNVGVAGKVEGETTKFVDQMVIDRASLGPGKTPRVQAFSNKSREFPAKLGAAERARVEGQVAADCEEALGKYGGQVTIRRQAPDIHLEKQGVPSAAQELFGQTVTIEKVFLVYDSRALKGGKDLREIIIAAAAKIEKDGKSVIVLFLP